MRLLARAVRAGGGGGGLRPLHQQGRQDPGGGGEVQGERSDGAGDPVEDVPPASLLRNLETVSPDRLLSLQGPSVFSLCLNHQYDLPTSFH